MFVRSGCEMMGCSYWNGERCTDENPLYSKICRNNDYWQTEEGKQQIEEYENSC